MPIHTHTHVSDTSVRVRASRSPCLRALEGVYSRTAKSCRHHHMHTDTQTHTQIINIIPNSFTTNTMDVN